MRNLSGDFSIVFSIVLKYPKLLNFKPAEIDNVPSSIWDQAIYYETDDGTENKASQDGYHLGLFKRHENCRWNRYKKVYLIVKSSPHSAYHSPFQCWGGTGIFSNM